MSLTNECANRKIPIEYVIARERERETVCVCGSILYPAIRLFIYLSAVIYSIHCPLCNYNVMSMYVRGYVMCQIGVTDVEERSLEHLDTSAIRYRAINTGDRCFGEGLESARNLANVVRLLREPTRDHDCILILFSCVCD
jgi:hypothetical protein